MTWPEVLPVLVVAVGIAASLAALAWTLGRIFRPWMRNEVRDGMEALYDRLKANDFRHLEDRMVEGLAGVHQRLDGVEARFAERFDGVAERFDGVAERFDGVAKRFDGIDARFAERFDGVAKRFDGIDARFAERFDGVAKRFDGVAERFDGIDARLDRMERRAEAREVRIMAALSGRGEGKDPPPRPISAPESEGAHEGE